MAEFAALSYQDYLIIYPRYEQQVFLLSSAESIFLSSLRRRKNLIFRLFGKPKSFWSIYCSPRAQISIKTLKTFFPTLFSDEFKFQRLLWYFAAAAVEDQKFSSTLFSAAVEVCGVVILKPILHQLFNTQLGKFGTWNLRTWPGWLYYKITFGLL